MKTALITGAFGQDGYFLTKKLIELQNYKIICTSHSIKANLDPIYKNKKIEIELLDIRNDYSIFNIIKKTQPDELYHFASFSAPILSWENPKDVISINGNSTICFLDSIRLYSDKTKFFFPSSAKIFNYKLESPQTENTPIEPQDPYSLGKYIGHQAVKLYRKKYGLFAVNGILYNHESYLKNVNFVTYKICYFAKLLKQKKISSFSLLSLNSEIDLGDPRDYVTASHLILQQSLPGDYIISMNSAISIRDICVLIGKILNIPNILTSIKTEEPNNDNKSLKMIGDNTKLKNIGWKPYYKIEETLRMILDNDKMKLI